MVECPLILNSWLQNTHSALLVVLRFTLTLFGPILPCGVLPLHPVFVMAGVSTTFTTMTKSLSELLTMQTKSIDSDNNSVFLVVIHTKNMLGTQTGF